MIIRILIFVLFFYSYSIIIYSQEIKSKSENFQTGEIKSNNKIDGANSTENLIIKDYDQNILMQVTDEGNAGSILIPNLISIPADLGNKIYSFNNVLYWNGATVHVGAGTEVSSINDLIDGKSDNSSVYLGVSSGLLDDETDNKNVGLGYSVLHGNTSGIQNIAIGYESLFENQTGQNNYAFGYRALYQNKGSSNIGMGYMSMFNHTSGNQNIALGGYSLQDVSTGANNVAVGYSSFPDGNGSNNTVIGTQAGLNSSGDGNVFIGYQAGYNVTSGNKLFINNSSGAWPLIWGDFSNYKVRIAANEQIGGNIMFYVNGTAGGASSWSSSSDERLKKNINTISDALEKVKKLRGVNFEWRDTENHSSGVKMGFIAQEAKVVIPEVVSKSGEYYSMQYASITALLVEAVKEQNKEFKNENAELKKRIEQLEKIVLEIVKNRNNTKLTGVLK